MKLEQNTGKIFIEKEKNSMRDKRIYFVYGCYWMKNEKTTIL